MKRKRIEAACVDMWEPFRLSIMQWTPQCKIIYDKFHIMQHANDAIDEVPRAEFFALSARTMSRTWWGRRFLSSIFLMSG